MIRVHSIRKVVVDIGYVDWSSIEKGSSLNNKGLSQNSYFIDLARLCRAAVSLKASVHIINWEVIRRRRRLEDENEEIGKGREHIRYSFD